MFMRRTLSRTRKANAGISTILGMLIFIGVLFTCVIPLFLYVNEVNNTYDRTVVEMKNFDGDKQTELLDVYAYPLGQSDPRICLYLKNKCPLVVEVKRVWINNDAFELSFNVSSMQFNTTDPIDVSSLLPTQGTTDFKVKVTTTRGNSFASLTNPLTYTAESGWAGSVGFGINIVLEIERSQWPHSPFWHKHVTYNFKVSNASNPSQLPFYDESETIYWSAQSYFKRVNLSGPGNYNVTVTRGTWVSTGHQTGYWNWQKIHSENVEITWYNPSQWVYAIEQ